ncbi:MAG TPA: protein phosphatase 2C domain-containing protein [Polyangia bacterium]|jgi:protein phosphatase|nr:protein phosphatase 2C domain-containing protein [Polyangia bacterium]
MPAPSTPARPLLSACGYTHAGQKRSSNEDAIGNFVDDRLFVVADGVGGHSAGDVAAATAVDALATFFRTFHSDPRQSWPYPVDRSMSLGANLLRVGIKVANEQVRTAAASDRSRARMASTIVAMAIGDTQLVVAHTGDSRAYRIRERAIQRLTRDHSIMEEMLAARPDLHPDEIATFSHRNVVTKALGSKDEIEPTVSIETLQPGDLYLLCSDGLWSMVKDEQIAQIAGSTSDLEAACQLLLDAANEAGGPDNISAILVRVG